MIASTKVSEQVESRWAKIVERFRAACVLYKEGDEGESRRIIKEELPGSFELGSNCFQVPSRAMLRLTLGICSIANSPS